MTMGNRWQESVQADGQLVAALRKFPRQGLFELQITCQAPLDGLLVVTREQRQALIPAVGGMSPPASWRKGPLDQVIGELHIRLV